MSTSSPLTFSTKSVRFHGDTKRIVLQNENGPCPLLAILNALILKGKLELPAGSSKVDSSGLQHQLVGHIVDSSTALALSVPGGDQQDRAANLQYQIDDTIKLVMMGRFIEGMDVNLEFGDCIGFEYTRELAVFDLCGVSLLHGWIADAESSTAMKKLSKMSYNEATLTVFGGLADDPLVASLRSSLSASARIQINNSMALSADATQIDAIASTSNVDAPPASGCSQGLDSTQASASTDESDVQDVVSDIVARVSDQAETSNSLNDIDPFAQASAPSAESAQSPGLAGPAPSRSKSSKTCTQVELHAIAQFLQDSQSQLTVSGLIAIADRMNAGEVAAFFRNNHFNTLYKHHDDALYVLVTDEGYINEEGVVWERLCSEIGDTTFVSADFEAYGAFRDRQVAEQEEALRQIRLAEQASLASNPAAAAPHASGVPMGTGAHSHASQAESDYALALQLHQAEQEAAQRQNTAIQGAPQSTLQGAVGPRSGASQLNEGPRRFSGARHSGPVYVEPDQGRPGSGRGRHGGRQGGRNASSSDNCSIM